MKKTPLAYLPAAALMLTGCYNNPNVSLRDPGSGPKYHMSKPAVGPGTVNGGSTAGPQPPKREHGGHTQPTPSGARAAEPGAGHMGAPTPSHDPAAATHGAPASTTGNEKGGDRRGPESHAEHK